MKASTNTARHAFQGLLFSLIFILVTGINNAIAIETITYYHQDALGSPVAATNADGSVKWREDYTPLGERIRKPTNVSNNNWYTGKPEETALGLQYFGARWYDPQVGRFTGIDPVGFKQINIQSFNRYTYANNNPYTFVDPDGNESIGSHALDIAKGYANSLANSYKTRVPILYAIDYASNNSMNFSYENLWTGFISETAFESFGGGATIAKLAQFSKKPFALGLNKHLDGFANKFGADTWTSFQDKVNWFPQVAEKILDKRQPIMFNMDGIDDAMLAVKRVKQGVSKYYTDLELSVIYNNPQSWKKIQFWKTGKNGGLEPRGNPFKKNKGEEGSE